MKATVTVPELIMFIGVILIGVMIMFIITDIASSGEKARLAIEQSSIAYYITASANALSLVDEGQVEIQLEGTYDLSVYYDGNKPYIKVTYHDESGKKQEVENVFISSVKEASISSTNSVCIIKESGEDVEVKKEC